MLFALGGVSLQSLYLDAAEASRAKMLRHNNIACCNTITIFSFVGFVLCDKWG